MKKSPIIAAAIIIIGIFGAVFIFAEKMSLKNTGNITQNGLREKAETGNAELVEAFAKCLASRNLTMYGAEWCSHCRREKALFGDAFKYVPYVECPENEKLCLDKGINGYPTWIDGDGVKYEGEQGLAGLAEISGCPL